MHWTPLSGANFEDVFGPQGKVTRSRWRLRRDDRRAKSRPRVESLENRVTPAITAGVIASSLATTTGSNATIGEIVHVRVTVNHDSSGPYNPDGFNVEAILPPGLQYLPGTATMALVSDNGFVSRLDPANNQGLNVTGNDTNVNSITPSFMVPAGAVTTDPATGAVFFNTGISAANDNDANSEFIVIEYNALVTNVAGNVAVPAATLTTGFQLFIEGMPCGPCVGSADVNVVEPSITDLNKTAQLNAAGDTATYTLTFSNTGNSVAYDVRVIDNMPAGLTLDPASVQVTGGSGPVDRSNAAGLDVTFDSIAVGGQVTITYQAAIAPAAQNGQTITNTVNLDYTSLPGPNGTSPNVTGSDTPGASGAADGERDGSGGINNYVDAAQANINVPGQPNSLSGFVYLDINHSGDFDAGDPFIPGAIISLQDANGNAVHDLNGNLVGPQTTGANGQFSFTNLGNGTYQLVEDYDEAAHMYMDGLDDSGLINGVKDTTAQSDPPPGDRIFNIVLSGGDNGVNYRFGECPCPAEISGHVYFDFDCNGVFNPGAGDHPLAGVTVQLTDVNGNPVLDQNGNVVGPATSDANGFYQFLNLNPGTYVVHEVQPTDPTLMDGADVLGTIGGVTTGTVVANDTFQVGLNAGDMGMDYNFFECPSNTQLSGHVYRDENCNGVFDNGDTPLPGVTIQLLDANGNPVLVGGAPVTTTTDANGFWQFTGLAAGTYQAHEVQPTDPTLMDGADVPGTVNGVTRGTSPSNDTLQVALTAGDVGINYNFFECPANTQLSGHVYRDQNCNGVFDNGDTPLPGVTIQLLDANGNPLLVGGAPVTTTTDANGFWQFTGLAAGTYQVHEVQPTDPTLMDGADVPGTVNGVTRGTSPANDTLQAALTAGDVGINYNFFECPNVTSINGFVYFDVNCNGVKDAAELGIPGVSVQLTDQNGNSVVDINGNPVGIMQTDATGFYQFLNLPAGSYRVTELPPQPMFQGNPTLDGLDTAGTVNGVTRGNALNDLITNIALVGGENSINNDFGECPPGNVSNIQLSGFVYFDSNRDLVRDTGDLPISGATLLLFRTDLPGLPTLVAQQNTNDQGAYLFEIDTPGSYRVVLSPNGPIASLIKEVSNVGFVRGQRDGLSSALDLLDAVTLNNGDNGTDYDFGLINNLTPPPFSKQQLLANTSGSGTGAVTPNGAGGVGGIQAFATDPSFANINRAGGVSDRILAVGADAGTDPRVRVFDFSTGKMLFSFLAYDQSFQGGVRVAVGDVNGDGTADIITAAGAGGGPHVKVFDGKTGLEIRSFFAYNAAFTGGIFVAAADVNGDGFADIITGAGAGGGPHVCVFDGKTGAEIAGFFAYDASFRGGVSVAATDLNGDGKADIITGAGPGGGPHVRVFSTAALPPVGTSPTLLTEFYAFDSSFSGGVYVGANAAGSGDATGDGRADFVVSTATGGGEVKVIDGHTFAVAADYAAFGPFSSANGVRATLFDMNGDGRADVVAGSGGGIGSLVRVTDLKSAQDLEFFEAFDPSYTGGVWVAAF